MLLFTFVAIGTRYAEVDIVFMPWCREYRAQGFEKDEERSLATELVCHSLEEALVAANGLVLEDDD